MQVWQKEYSVWHPGDRVRFGQKRWHFVTYLPDGTEQWVSPETPELWRLARPATNPSTDLDKARLAGPDPTHRDTMYRLLSDLDLPLEKEGDLWRCGKHTAATPGAAIYAAWRAQ